MQPVKGQIDPDLVKIIRELTAIRLMLGISMYEVSRRTGVKDSTLRCWERGEASPSMPNLKLWAKALGYRIHIDIEPLEDQ
jgi:transcriptional regulator with XRE-family HTH domain